MPELNLAPSFEDTTDVVTRDFTKPAAPAKRDRSHLTQVSATQQYAHVPSPAQQLQDNLRTQLSMPFPDPSPETKKIPTVYTVTALVLFCGSAWTAIIMGLANLF
ncbi:hypothetical protein Q1W73_06265 [Asticcacaulis sp. ZE23SCel15]|uniref:hypothetical protein n=1 Tax=Asticcacaulis sp. ZE23SCel15 TaxID=3059027 RepID=UPI00265DC97C|nr:hypothetical protein [Asticcacaulis sp. ZE23SCel15]WKL58586.1 hypothetical protein Q1W73_06265 [Asticcacaulis sp. ZE23SCel15]